MPALDLQERPVDLAAAPAVAQATRRAHWRDPRFVAGAAVLLVSVLVGATVVGGSDRTVPIWSVVRALPVGATLTADDLVLAEVRLDALADRYASGEAAAPVGRRLARDLGAGELVPVASLDDPKAAGDRRMVTLSLEASRAPLGLRRGDRVDVYVTPRSEAGRSGTTARVLDAGIVEAVDSGERRFGGAGDSLSVVLAVPERLVERVVSGTRRGDIDLVRVEAAR